MPGRTKKLLDELISLRTGDKPGLQHFVRAHLMLNGIDPDAHSETSEDDPTTIDSLQQMIRAFRKTL